MLPGVWSAAAGASTVAGVRYRACDQYTAEAPAGQVRGEKTRVVLAEYSHPFAFRAITQRDF
jgi:hypothetical protein